MGGEPLNGGSSPKSFTEIFEAVCPFYLSIGMTYEQFWYERAEMALMYRKAYELKNRQRNQELWIQGLYIVDALTTTVCNMFAKKSTEKFTYPTEPYALSEAEIQERKEQQAKAKMECMKSSFMAKAITINQHMAERKE